MVYNRYNMWYNNRNNGVKYNATMAKNAFPTMA